jgi:TolA-binding protein
MEAARIFQALHSSAQKQTGLKALDVGPDTLLAEQGWALAAAHKVSESDAVFTQLLNDYPRSALAIDARFNLAESASGAGKHEEVIRLLSPIAGAQEPHRIMPLLLYRLGRSQIEMEDWSAACVTLDRLIKEYPKIPRIREARFLRAEAGLRLDRPAEADSMLSTLAAEASQPSDLGGFELLIQSRRVQSLVGMKRWQDALTAADTVRAKLPAGDPTGAELDFARGRALLGLGRLEEARGALQGVIEAQNGGELAAQARLVRGETFFLEERFREALGEFLKVDLLYDAPRWQAAALLEAGKVHERLGQWADAAETYERLRARFPADAHVPEANTRLSAMRKRETARGNPSG